MHWTWQRNVTAVVFCHLQVLGKHRYCFLFITNNLNETKLTFLGMVTMSVVPKLSWGWLLCRLYQTILGKVTISAVLNYPEESYYIGCTKLSWVKLLCWLYQTILGKFLCRLYQTILMKVTLSAVPKFLNLLLHYSYHGRKYTWKGKTTHIPY